MERPNIEKERAAFKEIKQILNDLGEESILAYTFQYSVEMATDNLIDEVYSSPDDVITGIEEDCETRLKEAKEQIDALKTEISGLEFQVLKLKAKLYDVLAG